MSPGVMPREGGGACAHALRRTAWTATLRLRPFDAAPSIAAPVGLDLNSDRSTDFDSDSGRILESNLVITLGPNSDLSLNSDFHIEIFWQHRARRGSQPNAELNVHFTRTEPRPDDGRFSGRRHGDSCDVTQDRHADRQTVDS
ncbi:hypothetical protein EVAR_87647_1 [Eumeta japonica]|uniref:Uncharacterized protein n=1 Tax=Eumeta variegata TaxID=151549 RepID=A0A4C1WJP9_EUMVA|nr:hypothetical protein EVAR_87647_1 [Eumeta japonica]